MTHYDLAWEYLKDISVFSAVDMLYYEAWGPWWVLFIFVCFLIAGFISNKSELIAAMAGVLGSMYLIGSFALPKIPFHTQPIPYLLVVICLAVLLYKAYGRRDE